jgi:hypothetical protein
MASTPCCVAGAPIVHEYKEKGAFTTIGDMKAILLVCRAFVFTRCAAAVCRPRARAIGELGGGRRRRMRCMRYPACYRAAPRG